MENSGEAVDDQGSGWFQVKKKHRSSSKFSLHSSAAGFSGKNGSSCHITQPSSSEKKTGICVGSMYPIIQREGQIIP